MPLGQHAPHSDIKTERRRESLARYAEKHRESLRASACERMRRLRAARAGGSERSVSKARRRAKASAARYRDTHRDEIRARDRLRRAKAILVDEGVESLNEKLERPYMRRTQQRHEGRPPPRRPRTRPDDLTENQKRCRALRACGFEEDNGEDSDEDLPPGISSTPFAKIAILVILRQHSHPPPFAVGVPTRGRVNGFGLSVLGSYVLQGTLDAATARCVGKDLLDKDVKWLTWLCSASGRAVPELARPLVPQEATPSTGADTCMQRHSFPRFRPLVFALHLPAQEYPVADAQK
ncbi:hypothetical protein C8R47DRAFT_1216079 [Mycena vitilis]|nr:hypothetical protein C8R47DRAFT_1216079 [Mycena vitilis]